MHKKCINFVYERNEQKNVEWNKKTKREKTHLQHWIGLVEPANEPIECTGKWITTTTSNKVRRRKNRKKKNNTPTKSRKNQQR